MSATGIEPKAVLQLHYLSLNWGIPSPAPTGSYFSRLKTT